MGLVELTDAHSGHNGDEDGQVACDLHDGDLCYVAEGERLRGGIPKRRESHIRDNGIRESRGYDRVLSIHVVARSPILEYMSRGYLVSRPRVISGTLCVPSSSSKSTPPPPESCSHSPATANQGSRGNAISQSATRLVGPHRQRKLYSGYPQRNQSSRLPCSESSAMMDPFRTTSSR